MGGQSYMCPNCGKWFLERSSLRKHLKNKHQYKQPSIIGIGPCVEVREDD